MTVINRIDHTRSGIATVIIAVLVSFSQLVMAQDGVMHPGLIHSQAIANNNSLSILLSCSKGLSDQVVFSINPNASCNYDCTLDSLKQETDNGETSLAILGNDMQYYSVSAIPSISSSTVVPLRIVCSEPGYYTLSVRGAVSFEYRYPIILKDKELGKIIELRNDSVYSFYFSSASAADRFQIVFDYPSLINQSDAQVQPMIVLRSGVICVDNAGANVGEAFVFNTEGKVLSQKSGLLSEFRLTVKTPGIYIVRIHCDGHFIVKKIYYPAS